MNFGLDYYTRNARLKPALIAALPAAWTVMAWAPGHALGWGGLWAVIVGAGGTFLLSQMARDRGKRMEPGLFAKFGGRPTEKFLSHAHAPNKVRLGLLHEKLAQLVPEVYIPTADEERRDPAAANDVYEACVRRVIALTREDRLLLQENTNYGFRRNMWGLRPFGVAIASAAVLVLGLRLFMDLSSHRTVSPLVATFEVLNVAMLVVWTLWATPASARIAANAYAERLFDAVEALAGPRG